MRDPDQPSPASILSALLLNPTAFINTPSLASLRATLDSANPHLSAITTDHSLKVALKQVVTHRRRVVDQVEDQIGRYQLFGTQPKRAANLAEVDGLGDGDEDELDSNPGALALADVVALLTAEEDRLTGSIAHTDAQLSKAKSDLETAVRRIESINLPNAEDTPPSVRREMGAKLDGLHDNVEMFQSQVDKINARAEGTGR